MAALRVQSASEAAAFLTPTDDLAVGLGPAHPNAFLHALGERTDWVDLQVSGALLTDLYAVFMQPSVHFRSGFFGPAERMLRDAGADIQYVPADFRRFGPILESLKPRVLATAASAPDADGYCSFSLHAGATIDAFHQAGADPDRLLIVNTAAGMLPRKDENAMRAEAVLRGVYMASTMNAARAAVLGIHSLREHPLTVCSLQEHAKVLPKQA